MNYNQICLIPNLGILDSRDNANVSCDFAGRNWKLPVVPANMEASISFELAEWMADNDYFYILHRFYDYDLIFDWVERNNKIARYTSISVGVKERDIQLLRQFAYHNLNVNCITLDIAHGHSLAAKEMCKQIKEILPKTFLIAGNVYGGKTSIRFLEDCGVDAIKVGLAFGRACVTYNKTGFASPMFSCGVEASTYANVPLIGDGGIREDGDISKALVAGYKMVMAGSIFAQCIDSPAPLLANGQKVYYGSASEMSKKSGTQEAKYIEGRAVELPCNNLTYQHKLQKVEESLRSAVSYAGGKDLSAFNSVYWKTVGE